MAKTIKIEGIAVRKTVEHGVTMYEFRLNGAEYKLPYLDDCEMCIRMAKEEMA